MPKPIKKSEPYEEPNEDLEEELERDPEGDMESKEYDSVANVTSIEEEELVASPPPISYRIGSGISHDRKTTCKSIPVCGGVKKKPQT